MFNVPKCGVVFILYRVLFVLFVFACKVTRGHCPYHETGRCTHVKVGTEIFIQPPVLFTSSQIISGALRALPPLTYGVRTFAVSPFVIEVYDWLSTRIPGIGIKWAPVTVRWTRGNEEEKVADMVGV